jgi:DNA-binding transcriptional ArsR family regulator
LPGPPKSPAARAVYAALAESGTAAALATRTGLVPETVRPRLSDLMKAGLVEEIGMTENERGRKVTVYARVPPERVDEARAKAAGRRRRRAPRDFDLEVRKRFVRDLFQDGDLLEALAADDARDRETARLRKRARDELRRRERLAQELRRIEQKAADEGDPLLPFWRAWRELTHGADAARILKMMLEREVQLTRARGEPLIDPFRWADGIRHTTDLLSVAGTLHQTLHATLDVPRNVCPACGALAASEDEIVDAEVLEDLLELASGDD